MDAQMKRLIKFTACIAVLLVLSFTVIYATSYAKGVGEYSSDTNSKDENKVSRSSNNSQRNSETRTTQPEPKPAYTPPPSSNNNYRNDRPSDSGQRYSTPRNESAPNYNYTPPSNNRGNDNNSRDVRIQNDNPYNYRQPGNSNSRNNRSQDNNYNNQRSNNTNEVRPNTDDTRNYRQPNVRDDRNTWTRPGDNTNNNRTPNTPKDIRTGNDNPYRYQQPDRQKTRDNQSNTGRDNGIGRNDRNGTNQSNSRDIRPNDTNTRNDSGNRQFSSRDLPSTRNLGKDFRLPNDPRKEYRKEYEDVGSIWRQRNERRESHPDRDRRHGTNINIIIGNPIFLHYCYDYRPLYSYPSVYCYYYDYFPPYIYGDVVHYYEPFEYRTRYNEITIFLNYPDNYYVSDPSRRALNTALSDIEQAWEQKDIDRFMMYVRPKSSIAIFMKGSYAYSLDWLDYSDMTRDAMTSIDTKSFQFEKLTRRQKTGEITAYGRHKFYDWDGSLDTVYVRYTFERVSGEWYITEAETSNYKNW